MENDGRRDYRHDRRDFRRGRSLAGGFWLLVAGCVLIALGLSFGGQWLGGRWWPGHSGSFNFNFGDQDGGQRMRPVVTLDGTVSGSVRNVDIDLKGAALSIRRGTNPGWRAVDFEEGSVEVTERDDTLVVRVPRWRDSFPFGNMEKGPEFTLVLPAGIRLEDCLVKIGAGAVTLEDLEAEDFRLEGGAGSFKAEGFTARRATVKTGAGLVELDDASVGTLRVETGAGRIVLRGDISEGADVSTGTGSVEFSLAGSEEDYRFDFARGLGSVRIGSGTWDGMGDGMAGNPDSNRRIKLSTGIGSVRIDFER